MTNTTEIIVAWSGGKDSTLTLQSLQMSSVFEPVALLTTVTSDYDRISMHGVRTSLLKTQVKSLGLPLIEALIPANSDNESYERAMATSLDKIRVSFPRVKHLAFGDLFLEDVRAYREKQLSATGFTPVFPLWGLDTRELAERFIAAGFEAVAVCVDTQQIDGTFAGRSFDRQFVHDLIAPADPCGENGEFHTFVTAGPIFREPITYSIGERVLRDARFLYCDLLPTAL